MNDAGEVLKARLRNALDTARQARQAEEAKLRAIRAAAGAPLGDHSIPELMALLEDEIIAWRAAAAEYDEMGLPDDARRLQAQVALLVSSLAN